MSFKAPFKLTREKHLDHMVRVVPFIVLFYAINGYVINQIVQEPSFMIFGLGGGLVLMIAGFITYDVYHQVEFFEDHLTLKFLFLKKSIPYSSIAAVGILESNNTFASLQIRTHQGNRYRMYFVDDADKVKAFLEGTKEIPQKKAA